MPLPLLAILLDLIAFISYIFQLFHQTTQIYLLGILFQTIIVIILFLLVRRYYQKEYVAKPAGYRYPTVRFSTILLSFMINLIVLLLFLLNLFNITPIVFTGY